MGSKAVRGVFRGQTHLRRLLGALLLNRSVIVCNIILWMKESKTLPHDGKDFLLQFKGNAMKSKVHFFKMLDGTPTGQRQKCRIAYHARYQNG